VSRPLSHVVRYAAWLAAPLVAGLVLVLGAEVFGTGLTTFVILGLVATCAMGGVVYLSGVGGWNSPDE
jgi:hypothetical protein